MSRRLHGRRGLKFEFHVAGEFKIRRRLHGRRGLKSQLAEAGVQLFGRRLHGRRGLKFTGSGEPLYSDMVAAFTGGVD